MRQYEPNLSLMGRLLLAALFLWAALHKVFNPEGTQQYMAAHGLTVGTMLLYLAATVIEFAGGIALAVGHTTREAVFLLVLFMVMVTGIFHTHLADPNQVIQFAKNVAIIGGLFYIGAYGPGTRSMDAQDNVPGHAGIAGPHHAALTLAGCICIGGLFLLSAMNKILDPEGTRQYMTAMGMVSATELFYAAAVVLEMGGAPDPVHHSRDPDFSSDIHEFRPRRDGTRPTVSLDEEPGDHWWPRVCLGIWGRVAQSRRQAKLRPLMAERGRAIRGHCH